MSSPGRAISTNFRPAAYPDKTAEKHCQKKRNAAKKSFTMQIYTGQYIFFAL